MNHGNGVSRGDRDRNVELIAVSGWDTVPPDAVSHGPYPKFGVRLVDWHQGIPSLRNGARCK
jgi:hypothetical protein